MAKTINLTVSKQEYENRPTAARLGYAYSVKDEAGDTLNGHNEVSQFDAVDKALYNVLKRAAMHYYDVDVTITGATLSEELQSFLVDKYEVESQVSSITFA